MHVIFICNELPPSPSGGIGRFVRVLAPEIAKLGHAVTVVGAYDKDYEWDLEGCAVVAVKEKASRLQNVIRRRFVRSVVPASVSAQLAHNSTCSALRRGVGACRGEGTPTIVEWPSYQGHCNWSANGFCHVVRVHGATAMPVYSDDSATSRYRENEIATARRIKNWIGVSPWSLAEFQRVTGSRPDRQCVVYNPVDCDLFRPAATSAAEQIVLYVGTLCERKGDDRLALAANKFLPACPRSRLLYVGRHDAQRAAKIRSLIRPDLQDRVTIRPAVEHDELADLMRQATVFAMPSRGETFGMVYAEAMASGVPVVAGNTTAIPEIVPNQKAGILVDADDVAAIADAVGQLLRSGSLRRQMGENGRRWAVEHYSLPTCVRSTIDFYKECLGNASES